MCNFFSCIITKTGDVLFTESESHEVVVSRSGLVDDLNHFVRAEYTTEAGLSIDERTIPEWYERVAAKARERAIATYGVVQPAWAERCNKIESLLAAYRASSLPQVTAGFEICKQPAYIEYKKTRDAKWAAYKEAENAELIKYKRKVSGIPGYLGSGNG